MLMLLKRESFLNMNIVTKVNEWRDIRAGLINEIIGFVPTMGNLHAGHISLCQQSKHACDKTVVSIFVNPTQFNQAQDFDSYPRTFEKDVSLLQECGVDYVIFPQAEEIYHDQYQIQIVETEVSKELEGEFRPGHFTGMLTVVMKLLNLVGAHKAYFGEKDYQQLLLVQKMVAALFMPVEIIACETKCSEDGLALSSRNSRLSASQRNLAPQFAKLLRSDLDIATITSSLIDLGFKVEYIAEKWQRRLGAVWLGETRLIDNIPLTLIDK